MDLLYKGTVRLETPRLILRRFSVNDANAMYQNWANDDHVTRFLTWKSHKSPEMTAEILSIWESSYKNSDFYNWAISLKPTNTVIGSISLFNSNSTCGSCETGYCLSRKYWGKGIMTEALQYIIHFAIFDLGYNRVYAKHDVRNPASGKVMRHVGMQFEGTCRECALNGLGELVDCRYYAILRSDFTSNFDR